MQGLQPWTIAGLVAAVALVGLIRFGTMLLSNHALQGGCPMNSLKNKKLLVSAFCLSDTFFAIGASFVASALFA